MSLHLFKIPVPYFVHICLYLICFLFLRRNLRAFTCLFHDLTQVHFLMNINVNIKVKKFKSGNKRIIKKSHKTSYKYPGDEIPYATLLNNKTNNNQIFEKQHVGMWVLSGYMVSQAELILRVITLWFLVLSQFFRDGMGPFKPYAIITFYADFGSFLRIFPFSNLLI